MLPAGVDLLLSFHHSSLNLTLLSCRPSWNPSSLFADRSSQDLHSDPNQARAKAMSSKHNSAGVPTSFIMGALCPETAGRAAASAPCAALVPEPADGDARRDDGGSGGSTPNERRPPAAHIPGLVRAKGRRAQRGTEWCFPADNAIPHQVITSSAEAILAQVDLHGVQSKIKAGAHGDVRSHGVVDSTKYFMPAIIAAQHKVRVTEEPSRAAINGAATINSVQSSSQLAYLPLTSAQLCHSVWSQSRSPDGLLGQQVLLSRPGTAHKSDQFVGCLPNGANQRSSAVDVMVRELKALLMGQRSRVMDLFLSMDANADGMITVSVGVTSRISWGLLNACDEGCGVVPREGRGKECVGDGTGLSRLVAAAHIFCRFSSH